MGEGEEVTVEAARAGKEGLPAWRGGSGAARSEAREGMKKRKTRTFQFQKNKRIKQRNKNLRVGDHAREEGGIDRHSGERHRVGGALQVFNSVLFFGFCSFLKAPAGGRFLVFRY